VDLYSNFQSFININCISHITRIHTALAFECLAAQSYMCFHSLASSITLQNSTASPKSLEPMGILFNIYYLHYMLYMFTQTLYAFSQPLYHVWADSAQHTGIDSSTTVCNSLPKVTKFSDFKSIHRCLQESPSTISTLSSNVNAIFSILTFNLNL
jgi:hypothetical protein